ncbi:MAG: hypothetical protein WBV94_33305 [Blastocatellia bacterium]
MPLQTENLVMVGLGIKDDSPPNPYQPALVDGIHLRWSFQQELGFPWYGFYLFRRRHQMLASVCLSAATDVFQKGNWPDKVLNTVSGHLSSDANLVLTDDFSPSGRIEFDLKDRGYLRFEPPSGEPAYRVDVQIGFRQSAGILDIAPRIICVDFTGFPPGSGPNPRIEQQVQFAVQGQPGTVPPKTRIDLRNFASGTKAGLNCFYQVDITLPKPSSFVELTLSHNTSPPRFEAFNEDGSSAGSIQMQTPRNELETARIDGYAITRVTVFTPQFEVWLHNICFDPTIGPPSEIRVTALAEDTVVAGTTVAGRPGQVVSASIESDAITAIEFSPGAAALIDVCFSPVSQGAAQGWERVLGFPYPMCLPVTHPDYPCSGGTPVNLAAAEALALGRVRYGEAAIWGGQNFTNLHDTLLDLVVGGPSGVPMAEKTKSVPATPDPLDPLPLTMPNQYPLDLVLLSTLHPALAQMAGLYWVDDPQSSAEPAGTAYDYLIVADYTGVGGRNPSHVLTTIANSGFSKLEGYIVFNKQVAPAAPLPAPGDVRAYALPGGTFPKADGTLPDAQNITGLRWNLGVTDLDVLQPDKPIMYHVWRADLGDANNPAPSGVHSLITENRPVLVTESRIPAGSTFQRAADWPPFPLHFRDSFLSDGWYSYQVSGIDIFGRYSSNSNAAIWYQWEPVPDPIPWYYQNPPGDTPIHQSAVRLRDTIPPPPPTGIEAHALDPADPTVVKDDWYAIWFGSLTEEERDRLIGLRVKWIWTRAHQRQAPDAREFRIYFHPGSALPPLDHSETINWQERHYVVDYDDPNALRAVDLDGTRFYEIFLPAATDDFRDGLALAPTLAEPVVYAHIGISTADDKTHTADAPKWSAGRWGDRFGNEGRVGSPVKIYRVLRTLPDSPVPTPDAEKVFATRADYYSRSFYTYRWRPVALLKAHIFRAMDDAIFKTDWSLRPRPDLTETHLELFPDEMIEPRWDERKRREVAEELNRLNNLTHEAQITVKELAYYRRKLSNDALRVLAGLPGNEQAFTQLTINPLDPDDPANANRRGPDNDDNFVVDLTLRAYEDILDGRATTLYFYRAIYVDGAHNRSQFSLSGPPVYLPNVVPPRAPVWASSELGEASVVLHWASNRERDLVEYHVLRTENESDTRDIRLMQKIQTVTIPAGAPEQRPVAVSWTDTNVVGGFQYFYRITAIDAAVNVSKPSEVLAILIVDTRIPDQPIWRDATWVVLNDSDGSESPWPDDAVIGIGERPAIRLTWQSDVVGGRFVLTRRIRGEHAWKPVASESDYKKTAATEYLFYDRDVSPLRNYSYRIRVTAPSAVSSLDYYELEVGRPRTL